MQRLWAGALALVAVLVAVVVPTPAWADDIRDQQWQLGFLRVAEAQRYSRGAGVIVAVVDSGVDATHPDLIGSVLPGADVRPGASGDGHVDTDGHGTGMAGLIGAHGHGAGNASGALGIAPQVSVLPIRDGVRFAEAMADGINWASSHGAKVISISQGNGGDDIRLRHEVEDAIAHDIVVVAAAGNIPAVSVDYPAAYPGVVAVGGVDQHGNHAEIAVSGPELILSAPAVDVVAPGLGHKYVSGTGTSAATAIVAGAAALVRARFPNLSATEVVHRLTATAIDKGPPGRDNVYGYGIVNLVGALTADVPPLASRSPSPAGTAATRSATPATANALSSWVIVGAGVALAILALLGLLVTRRRTRGG
jgi:type VII secretion-associated serine protease mycosin